MSDIGPAKYALDYGLERIDLGDSVIFPTEEDGKVGLDNGIVTAIVGINKVTISIFGGLTVTLPSKHTVLVGE